MKICISYSSISCILQLLRKKKDGNLKMRDIENVLRHPDYRLNLDDMVKEFQNRHL